MYKGAVEGCQLPWITRDFHTLLLHTPFPCRPVPSSTNRPVSFCVSGRLSGVPLHAGRCTKKRPDDDSSGRGVVGAGFRKRGCFAPRSAKRTEVCAAAGCFFPAIGSAGTGYSFSSALASPGSFSARILSIMLPSMSTTSKRQPCQMTWSPSQGMRPVMYMNMPLRMV